MKELVKGIMAGVLFLITGIPILFFSFFSALWFWDVKIIEESMNRFLSVMDAIIHGGPFD